MPSLMDAPDVLKKIAAYKADEVAALKAKTTIEALRETAASLPRPDLRSQKSQPLQRRHPRRFRPRRHRQSLSDGRGGLPLCPHRRSGVPRQ